MASPLHSTPSSPGPTIFSIKTPKQTLSLAPSSSAQLQRLKDLQHYLASVEEYSARDNDKDEAVKVFDSIVDEWMKEVNERRKQSQTAKAVLYGSKASQTSLKSDDIDILVLAPKYVESLYTLLQQNPKTTCLIAITRAIVPIIKCDFGEIRLDIGFVTVDFNVADMDPLSDEFLLNDRLLAAMEENMVRSFNAYRNAHLVYRSILDGLQGDLLPAETRLANYRMTILCIKLWAKKMGIYGSMLGYFGGISLAVMVAKVCQLYPNLCPVGLMERFFFLYHMFPWSEIPILVETIEDNAELDFLTRGKIYFKKEDLELPRGNKRTQLVISPAFPQMNTTYNVSDSQLKIIESSLREAFKVITFIEKGELEWEDLFISYPLFHDFDHFLEIEILSKDEDSFYRWKGLIQARLRYLILSFEQETEEKVLYHLWPQEFNIYFTQQPEYKYACFYYIGLKSLQMQHELLNLTHLAKEWKKSLYEQWEGNPQENLVYVSSKRRNELDTFVYNPQPQGFIKFEGHRDLFPQEKEPTNLLSKLKPGADNQMYMQNGMGVFMGQMPQIPNSQVNMLPVFNGYPSGSAKDFNLDKLEKDSSGQNNPNPKNKQTPSS